MANRGPIRSAFRRPFMFKRRKRIARPWDNGVFNSANLTVDTTPTEVSLAAYSDYEYASTAIQTAPHRLHRVQFKGGVVCAAQSTTYTQNQAAWIWAVYFNDLDDPDVQLWGATQNVFVSKQVFKWDCAPMHLREIPAAQASEENPRTFIPVKFDIKFRKPVRLVPDTELVWNFQWNQSVASVLTSAALVGIVRLVFQPAGMGR